MMLSDFVFLLWFFGVCFLYFMYFKRIQIVLFAYLLVRELGRSEGRKNLREVGERKI